MQPLQSQFEIGVADASVDERYDVAPQELSGSRRETLWTLAFFGVLLYVITDYSRLSEMYPILAPLRIPRIAIVLAVVGWFLAPRVATVVSVGRAKIEWPLLVFALASLFSATFALSTEVCFWQFGMSIPWIIVTFLIGRCITNIRQVRFLVFVLLLLNFKIAQFGIREYLSGREIGVSQQFLARGIGLGANSFFGNSNDFSLTMVLPLALVLGLLFAYKRFKFAVALFSVLVFIAAIYVSASRGALVGTIIVGFFAIRKIPRGIFIGAFLLVLVVAGYFIIPEANKERIDSAMHWEQDDNAQIRLELWQKGLKAFSQHPILGVGPGNFRVYGSLYVTGEHSPAKLQQGFAPHSIYIQSLSELGLLGTIPLVLLWVQFFRLNKRTRARLAELEAPRASYEFCLAYALDLAMIGYLASGAFLTVLYYPHQWVLLGIAVAFNVAVSRMASFENSAQPAQPGSPENNSQELAYE
ncbi:MAG: O-antigen ligase family protein [Acidobacteriaceae bacterium]